MDFGLSEILCSITALFLIILYLITPPSDFWKKRGIQGPNPELIFGTFKEVALAKCSLAEYLKKVYDSYPTEKLVGLFLNKTPVLLIRNPDLINDVMIKDFSIFTARGNAIHEKAEPLSQHLINLEPARWRPLRKKLTPMFSPAKIKDMFYIFIECGDQLTNYMEKLVAKNEPIEVRQLTVKYTIDVIGSCAFGLKMNGLSEERSEFYEMSKRIYNRTKWRHVKAKIREYMPGLYNFLWPIFRDNKTTNFFINCIKQTMKYREDNNIRRHDFVDLLLDLKNQPEKVRDIEMTDIFMAAQAYVFFAAGSETSSTAMSNVLYELAQNHAIQDKLHTEIVNKLEENEGILTDELVNSMIYLDKVLLESIRKYPPTPRLSRRSSSKYIFSGTQVSIPKGIEVMIPIFAIHRDPKIYPNPEIFDPERFNEENVKARHPMNFVPFGKGPRNCIGGRFANYQSKVGLIKILQNYKVDVCEKTEIPYQLKATSFGITPKNGIYLKFFKIEKLS